MMRLAPTCLACVVVAVGIVTGCSDNDAAYGSSDTGVQSDPTDTGNHAADSADATIQADASETGNDAALQTDAGDGGNDAGSPSIPSDHYLDELSVAEVEELCKWMVAIQGGPHTVECAKGVSVTVNSVEDCLAQEWPHCTVQLYGDCIEAQAEDICANAPAACAEFYDCVFESL